MIDAAFFAGWHRRWTATGIELWRAASPQSGTVKCHFCITPVIAAAQLLRRVTDELRATHDDVVYRRGQGGLTVEGEHFVQFALTARRRDRDEWLERHVGLVYADRYLAMIDATFVSGDDALAFRLFIDELVRGFRLRDGARVRYRRCVHRVPAGWAVRARDLTTHLLAPDGQAFITVLPAQPLATDSIAKKFLYEDVLMNFKADAQIVSRAHVTPEGLKGEIVTAHGTAAARGGPLTFITAVCHDDAFSYIARYERVDPRRAEYEEQLVTLVDSIEPVPRAEPGAGGALENVYWLG